MTYLASYRAGFARLAITAKRQLWVNQIARMSVVDREYFEALTGRSFRSDRAAIRYYIENESDAALGLSLSPLIEKDWIGAQLVDTDASWHSVLRTRPGLFSTSPYFDAAAYEGSPDVVATAPGATLEALRRFLRTASPTTSMPVHRSRRGAALTWGQCRGNAIDDARLFAHQLQLRRPRTTDRWDAKAEAGFARSITAIAPPAGAVTPVVSIIMPTRDRIDTLADAIRSVQAQTHRHWQLIVIDDGSTDGTADYVARLARDDPRVEFLTQPPAGVSAARNRGLASATGDFVAFLDSDNTWRREFLEYSLAGIRLRGIDSVHCGVVLHRDDGTVRYRGIEGTRDDLLYAGNFMDLNSVLLRRSLVESVGGFDETIKRWVDYDLFLAISATAVPTYLPFLGVDYDDRTSERRITGSELPSWEDVVVGKHLVDWTVLAAGLSGRSAGAVSVVIPTFTDWRMTATAVSAVLEHSGSRPLEVIVIDNASRRHVFAILRALFSSEPRVRVERMPRNLNFALANNYALSLSTGEFVVALNNDTEVTANWLEPLIEPLASSRGVLGTQSLLLYPDGTIQTAGTVFPDGGGLPQHFLVGHPAEDARTVASTDFSAVTAAALAMRASDLVELHGFDPLYTNGLEDVDLCLRALRMRTGVFRVAIDSVVYHHEGRSPGRSRAATRNRTLFLDRWAGCLPPSDGRTVTPSDQAAT